MPAMERRMSPAPCTRFVALASCAAAAAALGCAPGAAPEVVSWEGYLVQDPAVGATLTGAAGAVVEVSSADRSALLAEGQADAAGYLALRLPGSIPVAIRVSDELSVPTVFFSDTPAYDAAWLAGALFGRDAEALEALRARFLAGTGPLTEGVGEGEGERAALWVEPTQVRPWAPDALTLRDPAGAPVGTSVALRVAETGDLIRINEPDAVVDLYLFFDLPPEPLELELRSADGGSRALQLHLEAGELGLLPRLPAPE